MSAGRKRVERQSRVFLVGTGIQKSLSPSIHNALFKKFKIKATYSLCDVEEPEFEKTILELIRSKDVLGFNITAPFKERTMQYLAKIDRISSEIGAVNTVKVGGRNHASGYNTDVDGIELSLVELGFANNNKGLKAVVLGAGGAARAIVFSLLKSGFDSILIANRSIARANSLIDHFSQQFPNAMLRQIALKREEISNEVVKSDLLVNAVSDNAPALRLDFGKTSERLRFFDVGYKHESALLASAREAGIKSLDGLIMLSEQARKSFEIWTGVSPSSELARTIARRSVSRI